MRELFSNVFKIGAVTLFLVGLLFADEIWLTSPHWIGSILRQITAVFYDQKTQWIVYLCFAIYFAAIVMLQIELKTAHCAVRERRRYAPAMWLACAFCINAVLYATCYSLSASALILIGGAVLGRGIALWVAFDTAKQFPPCICRFPFLVLVLQIILLAFAPFLKTNVDCVFEYRGIIRWVGPWDSPNIFGLLMGTGVVLSVGILYLSLLIFITKESEATRGTTTAKKYVQFALVTLFLFFIVIMSYALLQSYSRGAWLSIVCGLSYLAYQEAFRKKRICRRRNANFTGLPCICGFDNWFRINWFPMSVLILAIGILIFWEVRHTDRLTPRRIVSIGNMNDFSWKNRVAAWEGTLQMMSEKPWFGFGWNQPEPLYEHYYLSPKLDESKAIEVNDYLMLGAALGIPSLFCFGVYFWLSLTGKALSKKRVIELREEEIGCWKSHDSLKTTCRAGAIVLLVGFWFDGGLFELPTASTFWILLELGC